MAQHEYALAEPGSGSPPAPVYPRLDDMILDGWRRRTPPYDEANGGVPQVGDVGTTFIDPPYTGVEP